MWLALGSLLAQMQAVLSESPQGAGQGSEGRAVPVLPGPAHPAASCCWQRARGCPGTAASGHLGGGLGPPRQGIEAGSWLQPPPSSILGVPWQWGRQ